MGALLRDRLVQGSKDIMVNKQSNGADTNQIISSNCKIAIVISAKIYSALRQRGVEINLCREIGKDFPSGVTINLKSEG